MSKLLGKVETLVNAGACLIWITRSHNARPLYNKQAISRWGMV
jgi:hypothetical protein